MAIVDKKHCDENGPNLFSPSNNYALVKYMDLSKFISMLYKQAIFFCRVDQFEDHFEGTIPIKNNEHQIEWRKRLKESGFYTVPVSESDILRSVTELNTYQSHLRSYICVNCWNKKESESAALWKIYSDFGKGLMIKSSVERIIQAFSSTEEELFLSEVRYIDHEKDFMEDGGVYSPILHKNLAYSYEDEVRVIHELKDYNGNFRDWSKEEVKQGKNLSVNLESLIEEIIVGPFAPTWFFELVKDVTLKYGLNKPIRQSKLTVKTS